MLLLASGPRERHDSHHAHLDRVAESLSLTIVTQLLRNQALVCELASRRSSKTRHGGRGRHALPGTAMLRRVRLTRSSSNSRRIGSLVVMASAYRPSRKNTALFSELTSASRSPRALKVSICL